MANEQPRMIDDTQTLPWWMPAWLWRASRTAWFASIAFGMAAYFVLSIVNDVTGTIPLWIRLVVQVITTLLVRLGFAWDRRRAGEQ